MNYDVLSKTKPILPDKSDIYKTILVAVAVAFVEPTIDFPFLPPFPIERTTTIHSQLLF